MNYKKKKCQKKLFVEKLEAILILYARVMYAYKNISLYPTQHSDLSDVMHKEFQKHALSTLDTLNFLSDEGGIQAYSISLIRKLFFILKILSFFSFHAKNFNYH